MWVPIVPCGREPAGRARGPPGSKHVPQRPLSAGQRSLRDPFPSPLCGLQGLPSASAGVTVPSPETKRRGLLSPHKLADLQAGVAQSGGYRVRRGIQHGPQRPNDRLSRQAVQSQRPRRRGLYDAGPLTARPPHPWIGGSEQGQRADADGDEMRDAGIVPRENRTARQYRRQLR